MLIGLKYAEPNIILEVGQEWIKAGLSGDPRPRAICKRTDLEKDLRRIFPKLLTEPKKVVLVVSMITQTKTLDQLQRILLDIWKVPSVVLVDSLVMSCMSSGVQHAIVIDVGVDIKLMCVYDLVPLKDTFTWIPFPEITQPLKKGVVLNATEKVAPLIDECIDQVIQAILDMYSHCPMDIKQVLMKNILVTGGNANVPGWTDALKQRLQAEFTFPLEWVELGFNPFLTSWTGASIMSVLPLTPVSSLF